MGGILVGTASWTDNTLLASGWYPPEIDTAAKRLEYYAQHFRLVEIDSTYYTPPNERNSELWAVRSPAGFTFNVKAFSLLTGHPTRVAALYKDLRPETEKRNVYAKDLPDSVVDQVWERFLSALAPLHEAGKLGAVLLQFPQWFPIGRRNIYDRLGYRYSDEELAEWAPRIKSLAERATTTHVLMNNCYSDYAQTNTTTLLSLLD